MTTLVKCEIEADIRLSKIRSFLLNYGWHL